MSSRAEKQIRDTMWAAQQDFGLKKNHDRWHLVREIHRHARFQVATAVRRHVARARRQRLGQWFCGKEPQESWGSTPTPSQMIRKQVRTMARVELDHKDSKVHAGTSCASLLWDCQLGTIPGRGALWVFVPWETGGYNLGGLRDQPLLQS